MKVSILLAAALLAPAALLTTPVARAQDTNGMHMNGMPMSGAQAKSASSPADKAFAASMTHMMKAMNAKPTGNPDRDFVLMMMPHHQGAVDMAKVELQYGTDPELRQLASNIVAAQDKELAQMKAWLDKHGK